VYASVGWIAFWGQFNCELLVSVVLYFMVTRLLQTLRALHDSLQEIMVGEGDLQND